MLNEITDWFCLFYLLLFAQDKQLRPCKNVQQIALQDWVRAGLTYAVNQDAVHILSPVTGN